MNKFSIFAVVAILGVCFASVLANAVEAPMSKAEVKSLEQKGDYKKLALYFETQRADYLVKAAVEKQEMERRMTVFAAAKYPAPVMTAKNRYEYFLYMASVAQQRVVDYEQRAGVGTQQ